MSPNVLSNTEERVTISLPDMFKGFLVDKPLVNSHYASVRQDSEQWLKNAMDLPLTQQKRVNRCDFSYFCAVTVPQALQEDLRIVSDWGNWVFLFDDMFDEGELTNEPETSRRIMNNLLSVMRPDIKRMSDEPVVKAHDSFYKRFAAKAAPSVLKRYANAMESYCAGALQHVDDHTAKRTPTIEEMMDTRRKSIGVFPMYPLIQFAFGLDLPDEILLHPTIQSLENLGAEFVMLMNDILSYRKEESENCPFNMVAVCRMDGSSAQEGFDEIASMVDARFAMWDKAVKSLPSWGREEDGQAQLYIQGIQNIVQANLSWSFRTGRYFGSKAEEVKQHRKIDVLVQPPFLLA